MTEPYYGQGDMDPPAEPQTITVQGPKGPMTVARSGVSPSYWDQLTNLAGNLHQTQQDVLRSVANPLKLINDAQDPTTGWHPYDAVMNTASMAKGALPSANDAKAWLHPTYPNLVGAPDAAPTATAPTPTGVTAPRPLDESTPLAQGETPVIPRPQTTTPRAGGSSSTGTKDLDKAFETQQKAADAQLAVGQQKANEEYGYRQQQQKIAESELAQKEEATNRYRQARQAQEDRLTQLQDQFDSSKVDPRHFWADKDTGSKVMAGISVFLGGYSAKNNGGQNPAMNIINGAINQDIDAQKANIAKMGDSIASRRTTLGQLRQDFGDDQQADTAMKMLALNNVQRQIDTLASKYASPEMAAKAQAASGVLAQQQTELKHQWGQQADAKARGWATIGIEAMKAGAKEGAKEVPATEAAKVGDIESGIKMADLILKAHTSMDKDKYIPASISQKIGVGEGAKYDDFRRAGAQTIGTILEGGKLTDADYDAKYLPMMPTPGDGAERAKKKVENIKLLLALKQQGMVSGFKQGGFKTSGFTAPPTSYTPTTGTKLK